MNFVFTAYQPSSDVTITESVYMRLFEEGQSKDLKFQAIDIKKLVCSNNLEEFQKICDQADFIYHYGKVFTRMMEKEGASADLINRVHNLIYDRYPNKSVCRNEKVCEEKNPDRKDFQYQFIRDAKAEKDIPLIRSYTYQEMKEQYTHGKELPLPLVFKDPREENGWGCLLIETEEQLRKIFDDKLYQKTQCFSKVDVFNYRDECFFQDFICSEPNHPEEESHARVLVHATAMKILGMTFCHAKRPQERNISDKFDSFVSLFLNPESPLFLGIRKVKPDYDQVIPVYPYTTKSKPITPKDRTILERHKIEAGKLPPEVEKLSLRCAEILKQHGMGGLIGIDVIYDSRTNEWKFLEANFPASGMFKILYGYTKNRYTLRIQQVLKAWQEYAEKQRITSH